MSYFSYPPTSGSGSGVPIYANIGAFPPGTTPGQLAVAADTGILYEWNGTAWVPIGGPGTVLSVGTFDSGVPSPNGAHIDSNALIMQSASATNPGEVNIGTQTFAGNKTFNGMITAANLVGQNSGDTAVVFRPGGVAGGVVYTSWTALYAAIITLDVARVTVTFDNSLAPCNIPAGSYSLPNVYFEAILGTALVTPVQVTLQNGCVFTAFPGVGNLITLVSESSTPVFVVPDNYLIGLQFTGTLTSLTGAPMIQVPAGLTLFLILLSDSSISGTAGFPLIELVGNATLAILLAEAATLGDNTIGGGATSTLEIIVENPNVNRSSMQVDFTGSTFTSFGPTVDNIVFGAGLGDLVYAGADTTGLTLPADVSNTKKFLSEQSILSNPQAPQWSTIGSADLPGLTGDVTAPAGSNVTTVAKIQGTTVSGTTGTVNVVFSNSPTLATPILGAASATSLSLSGQLTSTVATGTAPFVVASTTQVANLNVALAGNVTGTVAIGNGGTGQTTAANAFKALSPLTTAGDIIFENATPTPARLPIGSTGNVLTVSGGLPVWAAPATSGTVTSVNVSGGTTGLTTSGGPITSSGTITLAGTLVAANGGTGQTTVTYAPGTTAGFIATSGQLGFTDASSGAAGYVGEVLSTSATNQTPSSGVWQDAGSLSLTAGDWDLSFQVYFAAGGSVITNCSVGISTTSGNSSTGLVQGDNLMSAGNSPGGSDIGSAINQYVVRISTTTTYFAKLLETTSGGTPRYSFRFNARRRR